MVLHSVHINVTGNVNVNTNTHVNVSADIKNVQADDDERDRLGERMRRQLRLHGGSEAADLDIVSKQE